MNALSALIEPNAILRGYNWRRGAICLTLIAASIPVLHFVLFRSYGLSLLDEGFLWYGAQRVVAGEIPIRDFMAYEPARYYWAAFVMKALGSDSIIALRLSNTILQSVVCGMCCWLLMMSVQRAAMAPALAMSVTIFLVQYPDFKIVDFVPPVFLVIALRQMLTRITIYSFALVGVSIGLAAVLGRNHGLYGAAAAFLACMFLVWGQRRRIALLKIAALLFGVLVGYLPMLAAAAINDGFRESMLESVFGIFNRGTTNLALPWPRFWWVKFSSPDPWKDLASLSQGILFIIIIFFTALSVAYIALRRWWSIRMESPWLVSIMCVAVPYSHYALSRADNAHISLSLLPVIMFAYHSSVHRASFAGTAISISLSALIAVTFVPHLPFLQTNGGEVRRVLPDGVLIHVDRRSAAELDLLMKTATGPDGKRLDLYAAPYWPGAYAVLRQKAPVWEIYPLWPSTEQLQTKEIERLRSSSVKAALIQERRLDGFNERQFSHTHPLLKNYIDSTFLEVDRAADLPEIAVYVGER